MNWKKPFFKSFKIACAAALSIAIAGELGLKHSPTAGIITVLSIGNTKRETLKSACNRGLAFLCALGLSFLCFSLMGYTLWAFAVYLLIFAMICFSVGWTEGLSMASVLVTHFLMEESFEPEFIGNEMLIFAIGAGMGILVNLHLRKKGKEFTRLADEVDDRIKSIILQMSGRLSGAGFPEDGTDCFQELKEAIHTARLCAADNYNNVWFGTDTYELDYIHMREHQSVVLKEIDGSIKKLSYLPKQAAQVAELFGQIERCYHKNNTVAGLLGQLDELLRDMERQELPVNRDEFEARAVLFYILIQVRSLLQIKREFMLERRM